MMKWIVLVGLIAFGIWYYDNNFAAAVMRQA
jgi:hypothetical protein